ncbi:MAG: amino acid ABC transporter substrate-binding protein [Alphaproteobacteria bacterium]|nr:amino acid ABC transporter substrate-binding protein [Alphaproteobacteria bacterium]
MTQLFRIIRRHALSGVAMLLLATVHLAPARAAGTPIVIGGTLGLTGAFAGPSAEYKAVYDYWLNEVNKKGGLLGRPVKMTIYNDESTPTIAQSLYNRLIDTDHADLLLSPYTTFVGGAIVPIVLSHHKLLFNGGFVGINIFRAARGSIIGSYTYQEPDYTRGLFELLKTLPEQQRPKRVAIFTAQNPFPLVVRDGVNGQGGAINYAKAAGATVVVNEQYPPGTTDFTGLVQKAKAAHADILLELGLPDDSLQVARTIQQQGYKPAIFCVCGSQVSTLPAWPKLGAAAEGVIGTTVSWPNQPYRDLSKIAAFFKRRGYETVPTYGIVSYAILQVLEQAVDGAKTLDQDKLKSYILSHEFHTVAGDLKYQADGTPAYSEIVLQYLHGKNEVVWPKQFQTSKPTIPMP